MMKTLLTALLTAVAFFLFRGPVLAAWDSTFETDLDALVAQEDFATVLNRLQAVPMDDDDPVLAWIEKEADAGRIAAPILIEAAKRAFRRNPKEGFKWFYAGLLWGNYDGRRCVDKTAGQAIMAFQTMVPDLVRHQKDHPWDARAGAIAGIDWEEDHPSKVSPWWICAHGIRAAAAGVKPPEAEWLEPKKEWRKLRKQARIWLRAAIVELSKRSYTLRHLQNIDRETLKRRPASNKMRTEGGYAMWDSGFIARHSQPRWVTDDILFIHAYDGDLPRTQEQYDRLIPPHMGSKSLDEIVAWNRSPENQERFRLYLWTPGEQPRLYSDDHWDGGHSVRDGIISLGVGCVFADGKCPGPRLEKFGPPGEERIIDGPTGDEIPKGMHVTAAGSSSYDFHWFLDPEMEYYDWSALRKGHGRIVWGKVKPIVYYDQAEFYPEGASAPIKLPFGIKNIGLPDESLWVPYKGAYVFGLTLVSNERFNARWRASNCRPVWWVWPDGRSEKECIPAGPWVELGGIYIYPTVKGWLSTAWRKPEDRAVDDKLNAAYLITETGFEVLLTGAISEGHVSPNGCRFAFRYAPFGMLGFPPRLTRRQTFRVIDLCDKENRND